jgi:Arc/MetJ-type ribon-helix-helix transcriptional regulator
MAKQRTRSVTLPAPLWARVDRTVRSGGFATPSEVVGAALGRFLAERDAALRSAIDEGLGEADAGLTLPVARAFEEWDRRSRRAAPTPPARPGRRRRA